MLFSNPRTLPALLLCVGFGLAGYRWMELRRMPPLDPEQVELAIELNYALDLAKAEKAGTPMPDAAQRKLDKEQLRAEIEEHFNGAQAQKETEIWQGLAGGAIGLVLYLGVLFMQRKKVIG